MIQSYELFKPVKMGGIILVSIAIVGAIFHYFTVFQDPAFDTSFDIFFIIMFTWHLSTGIGILSQKLWGYYLLKFYLFVMVLSFPIGTIFGVKFLRYLRENNIKNFFKKIALDV